ncbi:MAG TPA: tripartite tricarboxylate transporter substrate binding protein [Chloroflexota bacterium]|nr:tripartite tricarboxylate transporter substrate binding protein [Chloroflexota bacterium]
MKRLSVSLVALVTAGMLLAGCSQAAPAPTQAPKAAEPTKAASAATTAPAAAAPTAAPAAKKVDFPAKGKTITLLVHWAAGGSSDVGARLLASGMEKELGANIEVVNKAGAGGQVGYTALTQAKPDGYTIGSTNYPSAVITYLDPERKASYTRKDFQLLGLHVVDPGLIAVRKDSPYKTLKDVIDAAKATPKKVTITTTGIQSDEHFALLQLQKLTGAQFAFVHFSDGIAPAMTAVLGGKVDVFCGNVGDLLAQYKSGEMRILGVMDKEPSPFYPDVKTFAAQGYALESSSSRGFSAPGGTPKEVVDILSGAMKKVIASDEHKKKMSEMGLTLRYMDPVAYDKYWTEYETMIKDLLPLSKEK